MDYPRLSKDARRLVGTLEANIRERASSVEFDASLREEHKRSGSAKTYRVWLDEKITDAAVSWVLKAVFVRFLEDNRLWP